MCQNVFFHFRDCNECRCSKESIKCTNNKCGDPIPKGCWVHNDDTFRCEFVSPCPEKAVFNGTAHCEFDTGKQFCLATDCNICSCDPNGGGLFRCGDMACPKPDVKTGAWHADCQAKKCVFVHPDRVVPSPN